MNTTTVPLSREPASSASVPNRQVRVLCVLFFFSGFPALIYQLVWQRALFRIFGVNIESVTIVVTAFMLGLGLGGLAGGWLSKRRGIPLLLLLATIETLTGVFGLFSLSIFERVGDIVLGAPLPLTALVTLALVIVPTLLMGATLPLLVGHLVRRSGNVGASVGQLYYVNTLGAGAACLACAVLLFPLLGMQGSVLVAVAFNAAVALGAVAAHTADRRNMPHTLTDSNPTRSTAASRTSLPFAVVLAMSCVGGLVSLSYEIFFFRAMSYASGSSSFAFATTLGAFLVGLASGARLGGEACNDVDGDVLLHRMLRSLLAASLIGFAFLPVLGHLAWLDRAILGVGLLFVYLLARQWGLVLPCLAHLGVAADAQAGMRTGLLYLANILGAATGSVLTGFILMDHLSLVQVGQLLVAAAFGCALILGLAITASRGIKFRRSSAIAVVAGLAVLALPAASEKVLESLQWKGAPESKTPFAAVVENRSGIVTVDRTGTVFGNGAYDGHFNVELTYDVNGIVRPYALSLFHAAPRDVLMIGLASGSWAQVLTNNPEVDSLTIVEINPGYVGLIAANPSVRSVLTHPKVTLVTDDGRRWLRMNAHRHFDAIVANTTYHFRSNATNLLSVDFLTLVKAHLNPGGILFYNTTDSSRVQRTGCTSFAHGARFTNHLVLSMTPIDWNFARWRRTLEAYRIDGRPMLNPARAEHAQGLARLMALESQTHPDGAHAAGEWIEHCAQVLARTAGQDLVTDDNMGTEWRHVWEKQ
ncbi:putative spermidine synthase [Rhodoferax ferrireducens T118]|uniref:Putative spermidine synthase n=1 Tax=Albidiferax ferrireducens (strain ATCC BAA-621 / DSM 15236 / T118) TaxID=338969 RepID=Q220L8_ALBFT|nr:fused MFS/spermidine synthase [Rhodoferax ferrireducens]ABD68535.1 putative spermidine synthase [Rhodoferax ferrireducens T118]